MHRRSNGAERPGRRLVAKISDRHRRAVWCEVKYRPNHGEVTVLTAAREGQRWGLLVLEGLVNIATAAIAVLWPGITVIAFVLLIAAWAILSGALMIGAAFRLGSGDGRWWLVLGGLVSLIYGALLVVAPMIGAVVLTWWLGAYALVFGVALIVLAFKLKGRENSARLNAAPDNAKRI